MKGLIKPLKIISIVLNAIFMAVILLVVSRTGADPRGLRDQAGFILIFIFPAVMLITLSLTFYKKVQILTSVLKIIAVILNVSFLLILIFEVAEAHLVNLVMWFVCIMGFSLPTVNILTIGLTYRKGKATSDEI